MSYQAGAFSISEARRIGFLVKRGDSGTAEQIFTTYLKSIEDIHNHAAQRSARGAFVDSLLELASFIGEPANELVRAVTEVKIENALEYLSSLRVHPNDRNPNRTLLVSSATSEEVLGEVQELLKDKAIKIIVR